MSQARAFSHVAISVLDLEQSQTFYAVALGFVPGQAYSSAGRRVASLMEADSSGFDGVFLRLGDFLLELLQYRQQGPNQLPRQAASAGIAHLSFVVEDVGAAVATLLSAGGQLRTTLEHSFDAVGQTVIAFCLDPDGNRIELVSHPDRSQSAAHAKYLGLEQLGWPGRDAVERPAPLA